MKIMIILSLVVLAWGYCTKIEEFVDIIRFRRLEALRISMKVKDIILFASLEFLFVSVMYFVPIITLYLLFKR